MALIRWEPVREVQSLQQEVNRRPQQRKPQRVAIGLGNRPSVVQSEASQPQAGQTPAATPAEPAAA